VVDPAERPERRSHPRRTLSAALGGLAGLALALFAVFLAEGLNGRFADPRSVQELRQLRARLRGDAGPPCPVAARGTLGDTAPPR
jgi:hypothetical protein